MPFRRHDDDHEPYFVQLQCTRRQMCDLFGLLQISKGNVTDKVVNGMKKMDRTCMTEKARITYDRVFAGNLKGDAAFIEITNAFHASTPDPSSVVYYPHLMFGPKSKSK